MPECCFLFEFRTFSTDNTTLLAPCLDSTPAASAAALETQIPFHDACRWPDPDTDNVNADQLRRVFAVIPR